MEFKVRNCRIFISPLFIIMLCAILLVDKTGVMLFGLVAVMIHEAGHFVFMLFAKKKIESAAFQLGGIIIKSRGFSGYGYEFLVAFGGCFFNLICCVFSLILYSSFNTQMLILFAAANFGLMIFNLMPINGLDGMDLIKIGLLKKYNPNVTKKICTVISVVFLCILMITCLYALFCYNLNPSIIICLVYLTILTLISIK